MTDKNKQAESRTYSDEFGNNFEMDVIKHFSFGDKQYALARERRHHHHGENCDCHDHHHHPAETASEDLYVFEWCDGPDGPALLAVSEATLQELEPFLAGLEN